MILAFFGYKQSGKTSVANHLVQKHGFTRSSFASKLKDMLSTLGLTDEEIHGNRKEVPCDLLNGKTPRWAMQSLGTEWGRNLIDEDLWTRAWRKHVRAISEDYKKWSKPCNIVVDDLRFPNEAEALRAEGAILVRVDRDCVKPQGEVHASEAFVSEIQPDHILDSNCHFDSLLTRADELWLRIRFIKVMR